MSDNTIKTGVQTAGDVDIQDVTLIKNNGTEVNIHQYVGELNIFEDMFKNGMYGNLLMIDAGNLCQNFPIVGEEYLRLKIVTPGLDQEIYRTFKIYSISDRMIIRDSNTQSYILHFTTPEIFIDLMSPIYGTFQGPIDQVVGKIWSETLSTTRNGKDGDNTPLLVLGPTDNNVKFTSPGWSPMHCINWLAARAIGQGYKNPGYLLFESNKAFYFANVEAIIDVALQSKAIFSKYIYMANNITQSPDEDKYIKDIDKEYMKVEDFEVISTYNNFKNIQNGYYANRLVTIDPMSKKFDVYDYDHVTNYSQYKHLENITGEKNVAPFRLDTLRSPASYIQFYPKHKNLYTGVNSNVSDVIQDTLPRRISSMQELGNFKIIITVPGRTDIEVGAVIYFSYPDTSPRSDQDYSQINEDIYYSGYYLVTAIRHKFTLLKHMMIMEIVKESYRKEPS